MSWDFFTEIEELHNDIETLANNFANKIEYNIMPGKKEELVESIFAKIRELLEYEGREVAVMYRRD